MHHPLVSPLTASREANTYFVTSGYQKSKSPITDVTAMTATILSSYWLEFQMKSGTTVSLSLYKFVVVIIMILYLLKIVIGL